MNEIVKVEAPKEIAIEQVNTVKEAFKPTFEAMAELEPRYKALTDIKLIEPTKEQCVEARAVRLLLVKTRTGTASTHKGLKADALVFSRYLDGMKKAQELACAKRESDLLEIEQHFENQERELIAKLFEERSEILRGFESGFIPEELGRMPTDVWEKYVSGVELSFNMQKETERKAEEERIAKEAKEREERERIESDRRKKEADRRAKLNPYIKFVRDFDAIMNLSDDDFDAELDFLSSEAIAETNERAEREDKARKEREETEAKLGAEREERERLERKEQARKEQERKEQEAKEAAEREEAKRVADHEHRMNIEDEILDALGAMGEPTHMQILTAIKTGDIPNITINY